MLYLRCVWRLSTHYRKHFFARCNCNENWQCTSRESNLIHALPLPLCKNHALAEGICGKSTCRILPAMLRCLLVRREDLAFRSKFELTNCTTNIVLRINSCNNWARLCVKISQHVENNFVVHCTNLHFWLVVDILR